MLEFPRDMDEQRSSSGENQENSQGAERETGGIVNQYRTIVPHGLQENNTRPLRDVNHVDPIMRPPAPVKGMLGQENHAIMFSAGLQENRAMQPGY